MKNADHPLSTYISQIPPTIHPDSYILAAAHPTASQAIPGKDAWFLADFYAFNYLFKGIGSRQIWLSAADPHAVLENNKKKYGGKEVGMLLHGNPYQDRKVVLSEDLISTNQITKPTVVKPKDMINRFLKEAKEASELARKNKVPLVLLVFCHGVATYHLMLDSDKGLSAATLKGYLEPGAQVTLITTAYYSGGWAINPNFNKTTMTGANYEGESIPWPLSDSLSRVCGSVFASSLIKALANTTSPLLEDNITPDRPAEGGQMSNTQAPLELQPDNPTDQQTETYDAFRGAVWNACKKLTRLYSDHSFSFSAQGDQWNHSWPGLTGIPVAYYEEKWKKLENIQYRGSREKKENLDQGPSNSTFGGVGSPTAIGGVSNKTGADTFDAEIIESMRNHQIQEMARIFRAKACPGDWDAGYNVGYGGTLRRCTEGQRPNKLPHPEDWCEQTEIMASIQFRWQMALLTDFIIEKYGLPVPSGQACLFWHRPTWERDITNRRPRWHDSYKIILNRLRWGEFMFKPAPEQGPIFVRPWYYLSSAICEADLPSSQTEMIVEKVLAFMEQFRRFEEEKSILPLIEDYKVRATASSWIQSVGKRNL